MTSTSSQSRSIGPSRRTPSILSISPGLAGAWIRFRDDDDAWVAIITGRGDAFYAGADLKALSANRVPDRADVATALFRGFELYKPVIAAVNGVSAAGAWRC